MDILIVLAEFVTLASGLDEDKVIVARGNYLQSDFKENIALVDVLSSIPYGTSDNFDGEVEDYTYRTYYKASATIDFYGTDAIINKNKFVALSRSQAATEFKRDNNIEVLIPKNDINLKGSLNIV